MPRSQVLYAVYRSTPEYGWEPFGMMYEDRASAEQELREVKPHYPTAFLVRVVLTRIEKTTPQCKFMAV